MHLHTSGKNCAKRRYNIFYITSKVFECGENVSRHFRHALGQTAKCTTLGMHQLVFKKDWVHTIEKYNPKLRRDKRGKGIRIQSV